MAFPLVSLQYNELNIEVEMRSINELFMIRDVEHIDNEKVNVVKIVNINKVFTILASKLFYIWKIFKTL